MAAVNSLRSLMYCLALAMTLPTVVPAATAVEGEPVIFQPAYAPGPADNPLKGFAPYAGQGRAFPHSMDFQYLLPVGLGTILPGSAVTTPVRIDLPKGQSGDLQLLVGVANPLPAGRPFRFANADQDPIHPGG